MSQYTPQHQTATPRSSPAQPRRGPARRAAAAAALIATAAAGLVAATAGPASAASTPGGPISSNEVLARAADWYQRQPAYNQAGSLTDVGGSYRYRTDCSGFVSMAWHLAVDQSDPVDNTPNTWQLRNYPGVTPVASTNALQPGDALIDNTGTEHHMVLFKDWQADHKHFDYYSFGGGSLGTDPPDLFTGATFQGDIASYPASHYQPFHYSKVSQSPPPSSFGSAFQANTGVLWTESGGVGTGQGQGMLAGTSPSMTTVSGQHEIAFQANTGKLIVIGPLRFNTQLSMAAKTSPAIAGSGNSFEVAYQGADSYLHTWTPGGGDVNQHQGMKAGTSPAIAATSNGYEVAFQANTSRLIVIGPVRFNTQLVMAAATNPAIAATGSSFAVDYQASNGYLHTWTTSGDTNRGQGMKPATSPAIAAVTGGYETAFQANTGYLVVVGTTNFNTGQGMKSGTSPAIAGNGATFHVAFQVNTGALYTWTNTGHVTNTHLGMNNTTSPATSS